MSLHDYKEAIRNIIDSTDDEALLNHWKKQLEYDLENQDAIELSNEEWNLVQEGLANYKNGEVISLEEFISKRK